MLHEQEVEKMLIQLLTHDDANVQVAAAQAIGVMAENLLSRDSVGHWGMFLRVRLGVPTRAESRITYKSMKRLFPAWFCHLRVERDSSRVQNDRFY